jgi:hypothetical protein
MRKLETSLLLGALIFTAACSPRDFLTRRLANQLIAGSDAFKATQRVWLRTGVVSNKEYLSPEYLVLQRRGWITGATVACPASVTPPPCWEVALTPHGVETFRSLLTGGGAPSSYFSVPAARRELVAVTGISKSDPVAEVDFRWKWAPLNEVGAALYGDGVEYDTRVGFRHYDDGWRVIEGDPARSYQGMDDALGNDEGEK